jgi:hypothetical protein
VRGRLFGFASLASCALLGAALVQCSLLVDTDGLSGGADSNDGASSETSSSSMEAGNSEGGSSIDGAVPSALGPTWLAYGASTGATAIRQWRADIGAWSAELPGPSVNGALVRWVVPKETPVGSFVGIVSSGSDSSRLDVFERAADGSWNLGFTQPMAMPTRRAFDIEYESKSNGVIVVYGDSTSAPKARRRTAAGWSAETTIKPSGTLRPYWIELTRNPVSDEIALTYVDAGENLDVALWDGTSWGTPVELEVNINTLDYKCFDAAYENSSGKLLVGWGQSKPVDGGRIADMRYVTHPFGGSLSSVSIIASGTPPGVMAMAPELGTNRIAVSFMEYNCNDADLPCDDFNGSVWDGSKFIASTPLDPDTTTLYHSRPASMVTGLAWLGTSGVAIAAYHRDLTENAGLLAYARFSGGGWGAVTGANAPPALPARASMQLVSAATSKIVAVVLDVNGSLWSKGYDEAASAGTWKDVGGGTALAGSLLTSNGVPFGVTSPER